MGVCIMDPDANLEAQLRLAKQVLAYWKAGPDRAGTGGGPKLSVEDAYRLAALVLALDEWICNGGFVPDRWIKVAYRGGRKPT
jgi:hypothetical protein